MREDDIWDEFRWEAFLRENDRRVDRYMNDLYEFMRTQPRPSDDDPAALAAWRADLRAFMHARGWRHLEASSFEDDPGGVDLYAELFRLDETAQEDDPDGELEGFRNLPVYRVSYGLGSEVLDWANSLPGDVKDSTLVQFCSNVMQIAANVAKGHGLGYERDTIGGNIACVKRGLAAANAALEGLREMKEGAYMNPEVYRRLYEQTYEVRNELGLYVQELRSRFDLGVD